MCQKRKLISRRSVLRGAAAGAAAFTFAPILGHRSVFGGSPGVGNNKFMVVVNLLGGNDGLSSVIPGGNARNPYESRRPNINLSETDAGGSFINRPAGSENELLLPIANGYDLHYSLKQLHAMWNTGELHVINKVGYPNQNLSHFTSQDIYSFGVRDMDGNGDGRGWLGRFADSYCANPVEPMGVVSVGLGRRRDFEGDETDALVMSTVNGFQVDADGAYRDDHALRVQALKDSLDSEAPPALEPALSVFDTEKAASELVARVQSGTSGWNDPLTYSGRGLGRNMRTISQLLQGVDDFKTKVFYTGFGGFDSHTGQLTRHESLMKQLDAELGAFRDDLSDRGLWDRCVVVVISEFGRRNFENGSGASPQDHGTDHGHGNCFFVCGGGVRSGMTGEYLEEELADVNQVLYDPTKQPNEPGGGYDFREIYKDLLENHLELSSTPIFPESFNNTGNINLIA
jgi:uncharacterized protein (DUF1501 family)